MPGTRLGGQFRHLLLPRITDVGPHLIDTLFERFISRERNEPPDIDVDFEHEKRDEVIAYIYRKYSEKRTALAASVVTYRGRSALREVAKAMGLSDDVRGALSGSIWGWSAAEVGEEEAQAAGIDRADPVTRHVLDRANDIMGAPRHLSQHVGGFVITRDRLDEIVPIVKTAMEERKMVEWDKDDLDAIGILKVDILALGMLSCLRRALDLLAHHYDRRDPHGRLFELATLPPEREDVYRMIQRADTLGVFQIELRAQMSMLPRLKPKEFYDLVIEVAIVRPGPIQGDMVHPYLRRRQGLEKPDYPKPELRRHPEKDARGAALPGAGDAHRYRGGRLHPRQGRPAAARHGDLQANRHHRHAEAGDDHGHDRPWLCAGIRRALLQADRRVRGIRLSRKPCCRLRPLGLCVMLVQGDLSRRLLCGDPQCPADGLLPAGTAGARRARTMAWPCCRSTSTPPSGTARWSPAASTRAASIRATRRWPA